MHTCSLIYVTTAHTSARRCWITMGEGTASTGLRKLIEQYGTWLTPDRLEAAQLALAVLELREAFV